MILELRSLTFFHSKSEYLIKDLFYPTKKFGYKAGRVWAGGAYTHTRTHPILIFSVPAPYPSFSIFHTYTHTHY